MSRHAACCAAAVSQEGCTVLVGQRLEDAPVEVLVDQEVAQAARRQHADTGVARKALYRPAHRLAELIAARRGSTWLWLGGK